MRDAIKVILREHGSIGAVLHGLRFIAREVRERQLEPDFNLLRAMVHYIDAFPERLHHPKEDGFLFPGIRARSHEADAALDKLEEQHAHGAQLTARLRAAIEEYATVGKSGFEPFAGLVEQYTRFYWQHMRDEEELVLPVAERVLTDGDWKAIDAAFAANPDPIGGGEGKDDLRALFHRITLLAPPPIGLGAGEDRASGR
jgi:hemerythrin-like domain-containing protein